MMSPPRCPDCGAELPPGLPEGSCPNCLLKLGLAAVPANEQAGNRIGRYKLVELIGEGGFGTVWLSEQQEPVRRQVALKIIKFGMDSREVVTRFEAERQTLALMDHPNIARVFDGGATESGRPYFVMELVKGVRITDYCDACQLSTEARLRLFIEVCQAVQHAHQKGVIHRDLKPSNVLVAEQDGRAVPKVIDFGIAKATEQRLNAQTFFTRFNQIVGTPAYMSPEQAGLGGLDIDTRSDIYALGVLLYELLTGRPPFSNEELLKAGLDQVLRTIREQDPPKPSTQLSTLSQADQLTVAQHRAAEPAKLNRLVRGELDWIVMKCLEKDRGRRYETANGLARDIEHHLNNEPVVAAAPTLGYQLRKFASRHRAALATATAFVLVLIAGVVTSTWQAVRANRFAKGEMVARQNLLKQLGVGYAADVNLAAEAIRINSIGRAKDLLERHRPKPGEADFRHWEWSYLLRETEDHSTYSFQLPGAVFNRLGIAPDGGTLAVPCGRDDGIQLWDIAARRVRGKLPVPCFQAFFSPQSHWIAAVVSQQGRVDVFDAQTLELVGTVSRDRQVNDIAFSPDETLLAVTSHEENSDFRMNLRLWRWRDKTPVAERSFSSAHSDFHFKLAFHPDGRFLALSEYNGGVRLLRMADLADERVLNGYESGVGAIAISPNGQWLVGAADARDAPIYVWNLEAATPPLILRTYSSAVRALAFTPDSRRLAVGGVDQTVKIWSVPQLRLEATLRGHSSELRTVGFLGDSQFLASGDARNQVKLWDFRGTFADTNDVVLPALRHPVLTADFRSFTGINSNGIVVTGKTFPLPSMREIPELGTNVRLAAMSSTGDFIASVDQSDTLRLWQRSDGNLLAKTKPGPASLARLGFVDNGKSLVSLDDAGQVQRWTLGLEPGGNFMLPQGFLMDVDLEINAQGFVFCNTLTGRQVISLADGRLLGSPQAVGALGANALSHDGSIFAAGNQYGQVELYETATWQRLGEPLRCHTDWIRAVAFSPDGRRLATGGEGRESVRLWDLESRQQVCTLPIEPSRVSVIRFSADGRRLAFSNPAGQLRIITTVLPF